MKTLAVMRLHDEAEIARLVVPAVAEHADAIAFLAHDVQDQRQIEVATAHPKCAGLWEYKGHWDNHATLSVCAALADSFRPEAVLMWDEDEVPPARFAGELAAWQARKDQQAMYFQCVWTWGDMDHIIADHLYGFGWHMKVYRWRPGLAAAGFIAFNRLAALADKPGYHCPYPYLHLPLMTPELRERREKTRSDRHVWWYNGLRTIPYDADQTIAQWNAQSCRDAGADAVLRTLSRSGDMAGHIRFLYDATRRIRPERVIELGVRGGVSTLAFLLALRDIGAGRLYSCDINPCGSARATVEAHGLAGLWEFVRMDDREWLLNGAPALADIGLIDTSHEYEQTVEELRLLPARIAPHGTILMHDIEGFPGVRKALDEFLALGGWNCEERKGSHGMAVLTRRE